MPEKLGLECYVRRSISHAHLGLELEPSRLVVAIINKMDEIAARQCKDDGIVVSLDGIKTSVHPSDRSTEIVRYYQCSPKGNEDAR